MSRRFPRLSCARRRRGLVHVQLGGHGLIDTCQDLAELGRPVPAVQFTDHGAVGNVERGEHAGGAVRRSRGCGARACPASSAARVRPIQSLDLRLLIHAQHHRPLGQIVVQANNIHDLLYEQRIHADIEPVTQVRSQLEPLPDPPNGRFRQPGSLSHRRPRPVRGNGRQLFESQLGPRSAAPDSAGSTTGGPAASHRPAHTRLDGHDTSAGRSAKPAST